MNRKLLGILIIILSVLLLTSGYLWILLKPLPTISPVITYKPIDISQSNKIQVAWTTYGEQAIGIEGQGVTRANGSQVASPTASIIKLLLALAVLKKYPLNINQQGPLITISASDLNNYKTESSEGQSVVKVEIGEQISEYQLLQGLLIASANNFADKLSIWAFGSIDNYLIYANSYAKSLGMTATVVTDPSGYTPTTISTPSDLIMLGEAAINNPIIKSIVSEYQTILPVQGQITNYDSNLKPPNTSNIDGIKTGNTTSGGGSYLYSSPFDNHEIIGVILNAPNLTTALSEAPTILDSYKKILIDETFVTRGQTIGYYLVPWEGRVDIRSLNSVSQLIDPALTYPTKINVSKITLNTKSHTVGNIQIESYKATQRTALVFNSPLKSPSLWWRLKSQL